METIIAVAFKIDDGTTYTIRLHNGSLYYYINEGLQTMREVGLDFTSLNLQELALKIGAKYGVPKEEFIINPPEIKD